MKTKFGKNSIIAASVASVALGLVVAVSVFAATFVSLGTADNFAIMANTAITDAGLSTISGDVGLTPNAGSNYSGLAAVDVTGTIYAVDATGPAGSVNNPGLLTAAKDDVIEAYDDAAAQTPFTTLGSSELGGTVITAGTYNSSAGTFGITGTLTLDAEGDPDAVFIFKTASTLTTAGSSIVSLINGAQACNVFWQVGSSATLGTNSTFKGNILALTSATLTTGANVEGRVLVRNGAVTLDDNIVTRATCAVPPPPPAPSPAPSPSPSPSTPSGGGGSNYFAPLPLINVTKIPSPLALPSGPGSVTFNYTATNLGIVSMKGVWVRDDKCDAVKFISGDSNSDSMLDVNETWLYSCTKVVSQTETNTATAHGSANGWDGYDTANATVVVGVPLTPPLIHLVKKPNVFVLSSGGGAVTYSYTVTNPGKAPLSDVSVIDDKCTGLPGRVSGHPGDLNNNNLLESNESWSFTCQTNLTQTTTNTGTAEGHANGLTAIDFSPATVVVTPGLPNTGFGSGGVSWITVILGGILVAAGAFYFGRRQRG